MSNLEFIWNLGAIDIGIIIQIIERCFIILYSYYLYVKTINIKDINIKNKMIILISIPIISIITLNVKFNIDTYLGIILAIVLVTIMNKIMFNKDFTYTLLITIISYGISYAIYSIATLIAFFPSALFMISNDYINLCIILIIYTIIIYEFFKIKKLKYGISFFQRKLEDTYLNILVLNIGIIVLFLNVIFDTIPISNIVRPGVLLLVLFTYMFIAIWQSFKAYYKQKQLVKNLEETEAELKAKNEEIEKLEKENLAFSKTSHSLAHKQKALEFKLNELMKSQNQDNETKENIKEELESLSKEMYKEPSKPELPKTDIPLIDNMLSYWQSECDKENIKFELQVSGNIHYMVNHLITEDELEIMLADHIKDAIIAIDSSNNENRSILVRLGKIDDIYSLYIYDSGIEFTKEVLEKLGKEPITTHKDNGGTGMGFMNTFDVLNKYKASLIINEMGEPSKDNYTKALIIRFDNTNEFKVTSYKEEKIK